jgi:hypothetical protein
MPIPRFQQRAGGEAQRVGCDVPSASVIDTREWHHAIVQYGRLGFLWALPSLPRT